MTKTTGLGAVPKGLEWLAKKMDSEKNTQETESTKGFLEQTAKIHSQPIAKRTAQQGLAQGWTRSTFIVKEEYFEQLKIISSIQGITLKNLLDQALEFFLAKDDIKALYFQQIKKLR
jgi:hypothetical protein